MTESREKNGASPTNSVGKVFEVMARNGRRCRLCGRTFAPEEAAHAQIVCNPRKEEGDADR
jgi:hypothetical protein